MWLADSWKEYKVLDASDGEKLEDWNGVCLIRPDPGVIWESGRKHPLWSSPDGHYHRSERGGGSWEFFSVPQIWEIRYELCGGGSTPTKTMTLRLKPFGFKHTGVFPEQASNWDLIYRLVAGRTLSAGDSRDIHVLNLFAYTGGATLAAAMAGAYVTHVDAAKGMVGWAKENAEASNLADAPIRYIVDDAVKFVKRELRRGHRYDGIIMDPPSYGRGPGGEVWKMESDIFPFLRLSAELLSDDPLFFILNSYTTGLQAGVLKTMTELALRGSDKDTEAMNSMKVVSDELGLPIEGTSLVLPQGAAARFVPDI